MAKEIERKYLVNHEKWQLVKKPEGQLYTQAYLSSSPNFSLRVRCTPTKAFLTIKGILDGLARPEFEYEIPLSDAVELINNFAVSELKKIRFKILFLNKIWEVDEFIDENTGLILAEIELTSEEEQFSIPQWIDQEVTGQEKYFNLNLSNKPFKFWKN